MKSVKKLIKGFVKGTFFEKPFVFVKERGDILLKTKWGKNLLYDKQTLQVINSLKPNSNCIDIGCHKGAILREIIKSCPNGVHYAFEPIDSLHEQLVSEFPTVNIFKLALSDEKGESVFYEVLVDDTFSGQSGLRMRDYDEHDKVVEVKVEIDTLDNILPDSTKIDFIKIDVEGAEFNVINGGKNTIKNSRPLIVFEFEKGAAYKYNVTPEMMFDLFEVELNYGVTLLQNWLSSKKHKFNRQAFIDQYQSGENFYFIAFPN